MCVCVLSGVPGQANMMDVIVSAVWLFLFVMRVCLFLDLLSSTFQQVFVFVFAFQILALMMRFLQVFSNSVYLGTMWRVIKQMMQEISKFLFIFLVFIIAFLSGLWLISFDNECHVDDAEDCEDYRVSDVVHGFLYVFEVFVGSADLSGAGDDPFAIVFTALATLFGTLLLTNLLIALMATQVTLHSKLTILRSFSFLHLFTVRKRARGREEASHTFSNLINQ